MTGLAVLLRNYPSGTMPPMPYGDVIRAARTAKGLDTEALAELAGVNKETVNRIELNRLFGFKC
jgi:DNA-binding XRE family transcriptional regulator